MREFSSVELEAIRVNSLERPYDPNSEPIPEMWTADHLSRRLVDSFATLRRMPRVRGPRMPGNHGPAYVHDWGDLLAQASDPEAVKDRQAEQNRDRSQPTSAEIQQMERCNEYLRWFRNQDTQGSLVLARWAMATVYSMSVAKQAAALGMAKSSFYARRESALKACAAMLNRRAEPVF